MVLAKEDRSCIWQYWIDERQKSPRACFFLVATCCGCVIFLGRCIELTRTETLCCCSEGFVPRWVVGHGEERVRTMTDGCLSIALSLM
jgi:hypothetical protein